MGRAMKQTIHTGIMGALTLFAIYLYYLSATPLTTQESGPTLLKIKEMPILNTKKEEYKALQYLNKLRQGTGLIPLQSQPQLQKAAQNHANYLTKHLTYGHKEESKYRDFTGEYASSRIQYAGYPSPQVIENVSAHNFTYKESLDGLFSAIYHRFAFLDFRSNSIGIGISQHSLRRTQTAFVYDMSSSGLEKLYASKKTITSKKLEQVLEKNRKLNPPFVTYPYNEQQDIPPAFFDELPDPLPNHRVSGFPISVSFNNAYHKSVKVLKFQLFNHKGIELKETITFDQKSDPHQRLSELDFVLFPLKRLEWNRAYHVRFLAEIDKKIVEKKWSFRTQKFNAPLHIVKRGNERYEMRVKESNIFYFPPHSKVDLLGDVAYPSAVDISFVDKNTIKLTVLKASIKPIKLNVGGHSFQIIVRK
jgi:uncharacterized protein YkwD